MPPFKMTREAALRFWLDGTQRTRHEQSDSYVIECKWQLRFAEPNPQDQRHYSIFCSMGDWNTNMTDLLEDARYDEYSFSHEDQRDTLFRYYTRILLIASEIITDFQDILTVFRNSDINSVRKRTENDKSRKELNLEGPMDAIQDIFDYINNICKHKTRNIHSCNHHIHYHFIDSHEPPPAVDNISIENVTQVLRSVREGTIGILPQTIVVPSLDYILWLIIHGYDVLDQTFQSDPAKFGAFCSIYEGVSLR
jgi:hypothetical protein